MLESGDPLAITWSFIRDGVEKVCGKRFLKCQDFYDDQLSSMENKGIILASELSENVEEFRTAEIINKFFRLSLHCTHTSSSSRLLELFFICCSVIWSN